jgi:hypothetical protein
MTTSTLTTPTIIQAPKKNYVKGKCPSSRIQPILLDSNGNLLEGCEIVYVLKLFNPKANFVQEVASQRKMLQYVHKVEARKLYSELQKEVKD